MTTYEQIVRASQKAGIEIARLLEARVDLICLVRNAHEAKLKSTAWDAVRVSREFWEELAIPDGARSLIEAMKFTGQDDIAAAIERISDYQTDFGNGYKTCARDELRTINSDIRFMRSRLYRLRRMQLQHHQTVGPPAYRGRTRYP